MQFQTLTTLLIVALSIATAHADAAQVNLKQPQAPAKCPSNAKCLACTKLPQCGFDPSGLICVSKTGPGASRLVTATNRELCPPLQQSADVSMDKKVNDEAKALLARMSGHIFEGEKTSKTSGRHTFSSWTAMNKDAGRCDTEVKLCAFQLNSKAPKTVFDDRARAYTRSDVETMCLIAIKLNLLSDSKGKKDGAFVVQNKFAHPVCINHQIADKGSCYPLGIHATTSRLSTACSTTGNGAVRGRTEEIPERR